MKIDINTKLQEYETPCIVIYKVEVEHGFAQSQTETITWMEEQEW